jgi:hypothetical protein
MKNFFAAIVAYVLFMLAIFTAAAPAQTARNCIPVIEFVDMIEKGQRRHVILRGDAMQPFINIRTGLGREPTNSVTDAVVVVFLPELEAGFVAFVTGEEACDPIRIPEAIVSSILRPA